MNKASTFVMAIFILCFGVGCDDNSNMKKSTTPDPIDTDPIFTNPLIQNDDFFNGSHWNDPHVLYINDQWVMYASSDISWDAYVKVYRLISPDGITWSLNPSTPVLENSASGWDSRSIETPAVVYYQDNYHLFYTGYDVPFDYSSDGDDGMANTSDDDTSAKHFKIGHAISADGINFSKQEFVIESTAPYDDPNFDFNQYIVGEPAPVVYNKQLYLYFTAVGADLEVNATWQVIGLMTYDGENWDAPRAVLKPELSLYPRDQYIGYSTPNAVIINDAIHLYYDVAIEVPWTQVKLHHAYSTDGETDWIQDASALLVKENFTWTASEIRSPSALVYNNRLYMYFAGHVLTPTINLAIGLEIMPLP